MGPEGFLDFRNLSGRCAFHAAFLSHQCLLQLNQCRDLAKFLNSNYDVVQYHLWPSFTVRISLAWIIHYLNAVLI